MELKEFQQNLLDGPLDAYLDELVLSRARVDKIVKANEEESDPDLIREVPDFCKDAWKKVKARGLLPKFRENVPFSPRFDGMGRAVPSTCLKIPTGGGKTLIAAHAVSRIMSKWARRNSGFVLWIVPNEAIYSQTKKAFINREHPYRQVLDRAAAGRVKILEKNAPLDKRDTDTHLCVMLLMLQSANRETKESLRMFRDRGNVYGFFPASDDLLEHDIRLRQTPNLDVYGET